MNRAIRTLLLLGSATAAAACAGSRAPEADGGVADLPPPPIEAFERDRPVFHLQDPGGARDYFVYSLPRGRFVMVVESGAGRRYATPEETRFVIERYDALHAEPQEAQDSLPLRQRRAEKAAARPFDDTELLARMDRTIARWREEKRALEIKLEAARAAGLAGEEAKVRPLIADYDRRILVHELKKQVYTSPEWKAGRVLPPADTTLRPADVSR